MAVSVTMKGLLEPIIIDEDFTAAIGALNISAAKGYEFTIIEQPKGNLAFANRNIIMMREVDEDGDPLVA